MTVADIAHSVATTKTDRARWETNRALNACEKHCAGHIERLRSSRTLRVNARSHERYRETASLLIGQILVAASVLEQVQSW